MPLNYEKLSPKGKFIRTCICVPILLALLFGTLWFLATHFTLGPRYHQGVGRRCALRRSRCLAAHHNL